MARFRVSGGLFRFRTTQPFPQGEGVKGVNTEDSGMETHTQVDTARSDVVGSLLRPATSEKPGRGCVRDA